MHNGSAGMKKLLIGLAVAGVVPALVILLALRFEEGQLMVAGQAVAEYSLPRLMAALVSVLLPIYLLVPLALAGFSKEIGLRFWPQATVAPCLLFLPGLLAAVIIGGRGLGAPLLALMILVLISLCLTLWLSLLGRLLDFRLAVLIYGAIWACSEYMDHVRMYVLPYLEIKGAGLVNVLSWLLPQVKSGPSGVDDYLQALEFQLTPFLPTLIQLPLLALALFLLSRSKEAT